jgi:hypothetical protein
VDVVGCVACHSRAQLLHQWNGRGAGNRRLGIDCWAIEVIAAAGGGDWLDCRSRDHVGSRLGACECGLKNQHLPNVRVRREDRVHLWCGEH